MYDNEEPIFLGKKTLKLRFSRERASKDAKTTMERFARYKRVISRSLREANKLRAKLRRHLFIAAGISEEKHPFIIEKVFNMLQEAVPNKILEVQKMEVIFRVPEDWEERRHLELQEESYYRAKLIPATESFIQALEEASPPDDGLECAICREVIAHIKDSSSSSITRLPCSHYYHRDCIVTWLHINHLCPTCRHPNAPSS